MIKRGKRSFIVIDPKGEMAAVTRSGRRMVCGIENVKIINPFELFITERSDLAIDQRNQLNDLKPASSEGGNL